MREIQVMARKALTDTLWDQLQSTMIKYGCYQNQNSREHGSHNMIPVVPKRKNAKQPNPEFDSYLYKLRHLVENMFARLKHFRSIATRYEKLARNFKSMLYLACTIVHCKMN